MFSKIDHTLTVQKTLFENVYVFLNTNYYMKLDRDNRMLKAVKYKRKLNNFVVLVIKNLPANARDIRDPGSIPGYFNLKILNYKKIFNLEADDFEPNL